MTDYWYAPISAFPDWIFHQINREIMQHSPPLINNKQSLWNSNKASNFYIYLVFVGVIFFLSNTILLYHHCLQVQFDLNKTVVIKNIQNLLQFIEVIRSIISGAPVFISTVANYSQQIFTFSRNFSYAVHIFFIKRKREYGI